MDVAKAERGETSNGWQSLLAKSIRGEPKKAPYFDANPRGLIFQSKFLILGSLRGARDKFFHESHCADFLFTDSTAHPVSKDEIK